MAELKQSRWVKIHEPGNANFDEKDNMVFTQYHFGAFRHSRLNTSNGGKRRNGIA